MVRRQSGAVNMHDVEGGNVKMGGENRGDDAGQAIRYLLVKAAIFIGVPVAAAIAAVLVLLK